MITLYGFGPAFGLPDPSQFVVKTEVLLKLVGEARDGSTISDGAMSGISA